MKWLLDTNAVSEVARARPNEAVVNWITQQTPALVVVSIVTIAELQYGVSATNNEARRQILTRWLDTMVLPSFKNRTLPLTSEILIDWLGLADRLRRRRITRGAPDLLLASTARVHNLTLVTRNVRDFADTGIVVYDPWTDQTHRMDLP